MNKLITTTLVASVLFNHAFATTHQDHALKNEKFKRHQKNAKKYSEFVKDSLGLSAEQQQKLEGFANSMSEAQVNQQVKGLTNNLGLSSTQTTQIKETLMSKLAEIKNIKGDKSLSGEAKKSLLESAKDQVQAKIMGYLTDAQKEKYTALVQNLTKAKALQSLIGGGNSTTNPTTTIINEAATNAVKAKAEEIIDVKAKEQIQEAIGEPKKTIKTDLINKANELGF